MMHRAVPMPVFFAALVLVTANPCLGVSVVEFGAKGDGTTDDTAAIQAALDAGKGPVRLPHGRYLLSKSLEVPSGGGLTAHGTLFMQADATTLVNKVDERSREDILIEGIRIEKRFVDNSEKDGIRLEFTKNLRIKGVEITGLSACHGISLHECENFSVRDCYIHDFSTSWTKRKLPGGRDLDALGIVLSHCRRGQVIGNRIENLNVTEESADAMAYQTDGINPKYCKQVVIANNVIRNVGEGIDLVNCESMTVTGNAIETCWHFGIKVIHGTRLSTIGNNTIRDAALAGMSLYFGNPKAGPGYGNVVQGNTIVNTGAITRKNDRTQKGIWRTWEYAGIELVNDSRPNNSVHDYVIANNVIYDDQTSPTCKHGIIERYITFKEEEVGDSLKEEAIFEPEPIDDGGLFTNIISNNLIRGMKVAAYRTGSKVQD